MFLVLLVYGLVLNHRVTSRFEARRWNLPSRIYSEAFPVYRGLSLQSSELKERLVHLGYRLVPHKPKSHGQYRIDKNRFEVFLHSFDYPHEKFEGGFAVIDLKDGRVQRALSENFSEDQPLLKLEPELLASVFDEKLEDRSFTPLKDIPELLVKAVILIEDERFYDHLGIDVRGMLRALFVNVAKGRISQGGSTLTQQMVKNFFLTHERTLSRKLNEILMSLIVELHYSKEEILEVYLNEIYFGQRGRVSVTGVQEGARLYFSKDVEQLNTNELAWMAAMIKAPGYFSPYADSQKSRDRHHIVLKRLLEANEISKKQYRKALKQQVVKKQKVQKGTAVHHFVEAVKKQIQENYPADILQSEGHRIFTTLDAYQQRQAYQALVSTLKQLESTRNSLKKNAQSQILLQGALVSLQPKTGFVRAYVGGRDYKKAQFDILSQAKRQPGSVFKPFVYLAALDPSISGQTWTLSSRLRDEPLKLQAGGEEWRPKNYDKTYHGLVSLKQALSKSYNVSTVWLANQVGLRQVVKTAKRAGITTALRPFPSLSLGAFEVTPIELASSYTVFANRGTKSEPVMIRRIVTSEGEVLEKKSLRLTKVFEAEPIFLVNQALKETFQTGTARSAGRYGFYKTAAGKTGTTSDYRDAWFVGYDPAALTLVWVGYLDNRTTGLSGASGALPVWARFHAKAFASKPNQDFIAPANIVQVKIDGTTGHWHHRSCEGEPVYEFFIQGLEPQKSCRDSK